MNNLNRQQKFSLSMLFLLFTGTIGCSSDEIGTTAEQRASKTSSTGKTEQCSYAPSRKAIACFRFLVPDV